MKKDLLTYVYEKSEYNYLSDLKLVESKKVANIIKEIDVQLFNLDEWKELFIYLTGENTNASDSQEIKQTLIDEIAK